jgi:hypothetical protein
MKIIILTLFLKVLFIKSSFKLYLLNENQEARCLDGSPYGVYYEEGYSEGSRNFLINFWGGGWCAGRDEKSLLADCIERSKTSLGSSKTWDKEVAKGWAFLNGDQKVNANFYNWHRFDVPYCDGSGHQGHISNPISVDGHDLYFRGHKNTLAAFDFILSKIDIQNIENVVVTGCSAGGLATYSWSQYLSDFLTNLNPKIKLYALPDSGFFINHMNKKTKDNDYELKIKTLYSLVNQEVVPESSQCLKDNKGKEHNCLFSEHLIQYVKVPLLVLQPSYDAWQLNNILGLDCSTNQTIKDCNNIDKLLAKEYHERHNSLLLDTLKKKDNISVWSISCVVHCFGDDALNSEDWRIPESSSNSINKVVSDFLKDNIQVNLIDNVYWPDNEKCSNNSGISKITKEFYLKLHK